MRGTFLNTDETLVQEYRSRLSSLLF